MLCPDGPDTGFVASNYRSRMRMILTKTKVYKGVIVPKASSGKVSLNPGALFYRTYDLNSAFSCCRLAEWPPFKVNGLVV